MDNQEDIISSINKTIEEYKKKNPNPKVLILDSFAHARTCKFMDMIKRAKKKNLQLIDKVFREHIKSRMARHNFNTKNIIITVDKSRDSDSSATVLFNSKIARISQLDKSLINYEIKF